MTIINPFRPEPSEINVTCKKCGHSADIILPVERRRDTDKLYCSKCGSKGQDLIIEDINVPESG
jgi:transcription elongation factor Elf1